MTNEELAVRVKNGDTDALLELWEHNYGLASIFARRRYNRLEAVGNMRGVDMDDLMQAAFLALVSAVNYYDPEKDFSFSSYWDKCIKNEFNSLLGTRTRKCDPLNLSTSLDAPLDDSPDAESLGSLIPDPADAFETATERIWHEQLQETIEKALARLSPDQVSILKMRYYEGLTYESIHTKAGLKCDAARKIEERAMIELRRPKNRDVYSELESFIDLHTNYYFGGNVERQESPVEILAERRERMRRQYGWKFADTAELPAQEA